MKLIHLVTRSQWQHYYMSEFNKTGRETAARMAVWYLLLITAFEEE